MYQLHPDCCNQPAIEPHPLDQSRRICQPELPRHAHCHSPPFDPPHCSRASCSRATDGKGRNDIDSEGQTEHYLPPIVLTTPSTYARWLSTQCMRHGSGPPSDPHPRQIHGRTLHITFPPKFHRFQRTDRTDCSFRIRPWLATST